MTPIGSWCPRSTAGFFFFFFNDTATTEIYTLSLHDALPICQAEPSWPGGVSTLRACPHRGTTDRKSTRLNSSHANISYAVFCLKKKKKAAGRRVVGQQPKEERH